MTLYMYVHVCTGAHEGRRPERVTNMIIFFAAIDNSYYSHTDKYIIINILTGI